MASGQSTLHPPAAAQDTAPAIPDSLQLAPPSDYPFLAAPEDAAELGRLGPYRVLQVLGTGAMGVVFQAEDLHLRRSVALKVMRPALAASAEYHRRFLREARLAAAIDHEHIVTVYQVGEDRGVPFLAMQLLRGKTLEAWLERVGGRLPLPEVLRLGRVSLPISICRAGTRSRAIALPLGDSRTLFTDGEFFVFRRLLVPNP